MQVRMIFAPARSNGGASTRDEIGCTVTAVRKALAQRNVTAALGYVDPHAGQAALTRRPRTDEP